MKKAILIPLIVLISLVVIVGIACAVLYFNDFKVVLEVVGDEKVVVEYGNEYVDSGATAMLKGKFILKNGKEVEVETVSDVDCTKLGTYTVNYSASVPRRSASGSRTVTVVDTCMPSLTLKGESEYTITRGDDYSEPGYSASDNYDGDITSLVSVEGDVDVQTDGEYVVEYTVSDSSGNKQTASRKITVKAPPEPPKPLLPTTVYPGQKTVYLTFDDGAGPYTAHLLDVLKKYNAKATFFVVKTGYSNLISRMVAEGHAVGLHTATHNYKSIYSSEAAFFADLEAIQSVVVAQTGKRTNLIRFPGGSSNLVSSFNPGIMTRLTAAVTQKGYRYFDWNVDSNDAGGAKTSAEVITNVTNGIARRDVSFVLQHDIKKFSVDAVEAILKWGVENGYTFKALDETSPVCQHTVNN